MDDAVDRIDAEVIANLLGVDVTAIPEDQESLTAGLWHVIGLSDELMPEAVETRWEVISEALIGTTRG